MLARSSQLTSAQNGASRYRGALTGNSSTSRGVERLTMLELESYSSLSGGSPLQGSRLASSEFISILGDVEGIVTRGGESGNSTEGEEEHGTHCERCIVVSIRRGYKVSQVRRSQVDWAIRIV